MSFVKVEASCAVLKFSDAVVCEHREILMDVVALMQFGFTHFIFDFMDVSKFSSSVLGFTLGLVRAVKESGGKIYVRNLTPEARNMLQYSVTMLHSDELKSLLSTENLQSVEVGGCDG